MASMNRRSDNSKVNYFTVYNGAWLLFLRQFCLISYCFLVTNCNKMEKSKFARCLKQCKRRHWVHISDYSVLFTIFWILFLMKRNVFLLSRPIHCVKFFAGLRNVWLYNQMIQDCLWMQGGNSWKWFFRRRQCKQFTVWGTPNHSKDINGLSSSKHSDLKLRKYVCICLVILLLENLQTQISHSLWPVMTSL